ncbi:MAG: response regulator [Patescibacteria group bacterium]
MPKKILIVDDDKVFSKILKDAFLAGGQGKYTVVAAFDGEEGFATAQREKPDLVMLDLVMPKMDGIGFLRALRAESWGVELPVIMETGMDDFKKMSDGVELGVRGYIIKTDYSIEAVLRQVGDILKV